MPAMDPERWQGPLPSPAFGCVQVRSAPHRFGFGGETLARRTSTARARDPGHRPRDVHAREGRVLGDKPALIDGPTGRTITYAEYGRYVELLAGALAARGIGKGDVVAIYMPNLPEYAVIFQGVLRANATNTTANPLYTERELGHQLTDSGAKMVFTIAPFLDTARAAAEHAGISDIVVVGEADGDEPTLADLLAEGAPRRRSTSTPRRTSPCCRTRAGPPACRRA